MKFLPGRATTALAVVIIAAVGGGILGASTLLSAAERRHHAADVTADLKFALSQLGTTSDEYALAPGSARLGAKVEAADNQVDTGLSRVEASGIEPTDLAALHREVDDFVRSARDQRRLTDRGLVQQAQASSVVNDGAFEVLVGRVDRLLDKMHRAARRSEHDVDLLGSILGISVLATVAGAVWFDGRRRRAKTRDLAERRSRARFEAMVEHGSDLLVVSAPSGAQTYVSPALEHLLGYPSNAVAPDLRSIVEPTQSHTLAALTDQVHTSGRAGPEDLRVRHADGSWRIMEVTLVDMTQVPDVGGVLWSSRDVTDRRRLEQQLERTAFSDSLTGLANRALFRERLDHAIARETRGGHPIFVLLADLDGFKSVNDSLGHDAGDEVLVEVAARLSGAVRPGDTVARLGGDEFAIILEDATDPTVAERAAERTLEVMRQPFTIAGTDIRVGMSIGIAGADTDTETAAELLRNADIAMYSAKGKGRGRWAVFEPIMHHRAEERLRLAADLDEALKLNQFEVYYQPSLSIATGDIQGTEALLRWHHPTRGLVLPDVFIPIAEETGQIVPIGRWVLHQACQQARTWHEQRSGATPMAISINLSGRQLTDRNLLADVQAALTDSGIDPATVVLEITETVLMHDVETVKATLHELKQLGVRLAIDDFGTGYSSLAYLSQFPIDILKIDRAFVEAAGAGVAGSQALVRAIVQLSASLNLSTIAEGIEHQGEAELLLALGCPSGQGFLYARPMPAEQLEVLVLKRNTQAIAGSSNAPTTDEYKNVPSPMPLGQSH